jgi:hypothetical protein
MQESHRDSAIKSLFEWQKSKVMEFRCQDMTLPRCVPFYTRGGVSISRSIKLTTGVKEGEFAHKCWPPLCGGGEGYAHTRECHAPFCREGVLNSETQRQATQHACLLRLLGDGD